MRLKVRSGFDGVTNHCDARSMIGGDISVQLQSQPRL